MLHSLLSLSKLYFMLQVQTARYYEHVGKVYRVLGKPYKAEECLIRAEFIMNHVLEVNMFSLCHTHCLLSLLFTWGKLQSIQPMQPMQLMQLMQPSCQD